MRWEKRGLIFAPDGDREWNKSHAQVPVVDVIDDRRWRIFYASRDAVGRAHTSYIDVDASDPSRILHVHDRPVLALGKPGTFDDCGIMPTWVVPVDASTRYLYYIGWTTRKTVPYHNSIGLAVSRDGGVSYEKLGEGPLFPPILKEPYFTGTACVMRDASRWKCWYLSCVGWETVQGRTEPFYDIKVAESGDGIEWRRDATVAIPLEKGVDGGLASASVLRDAGGYKMWFCARGAAGYRTDKSASYRIAYAESADGMRWDRHDARAGIDVSSDGWDSEMIGYPHVVERGGRLTMFYNGNGFGRTGFGWATMDGGQR